MESALLSDFRAMSVQKITNFLKKAWGADRDRAFKLGSWALAFVIAGAWASYDYSKQPPWKKSIEPSKGPYLPDGTKEKK